MRLALVLAAWLVAGIGFSFAWGCIAAVASRGRPHPRRTTSTGRPSGTYRTTERTTK